MFTRILTLDREEIESLPQTLIIIPYINQFATKCRISNYEFFISNNPSKKYKKVYAIRLQRYKPAFEFVTNTQFLGYT